MLGDRPIDEVIEHARSFVAALTESEGRVLDLGSGGGVPGLVIAWDRPDLEVHLVDRRARRTDELERSVRRLGVVDRCVVHCRDLTVIPPDWSQRFDAVVARGFGPPEPTLRLATQAVRPGGVVVISEPPVGDRWDPVLLEELGVRAERTGAVRRFHRRRS